MHFNLRLFAALVAAFIGADCSKATPLQKQVFRTVDDLQAITLISADELEIGERGTNFVCKYSTQGDRLRVIITRMGTTEALYFRYTDKGLEDEHGTIFYNPAALVAAQKAIADARQREDEVRKRQIEAKQARYAATHKRLDDYFAPGSQFKVKYDRYGWTDHAVATVISRDVTTGKFQGKLTDSAPGVFGGEYQVYDSNPNNRVFIQIKHGPDYNNSLEDNYYNAPLSSDDFVSEFNSSNGFTVSLTKLRPDADSSAASKKEAVKTTASGLQYKVIKEGIGPQPKKDDTVTVNYRGTLTNGTEFDSSYRHGQPATFPVNAVIKGWTEALQMMKVGSKYQLIIPPDLAYGERAVGTQIPPNSTLIFEVELLEVKPTSASGP
jgi:hypothetical protein